MDKKLLLGIGLCIVVLLGLIFSIGKELDKLGEYQMSIEKKVGTKCYFNGDSILIIDYSLLNETYTLSNGTKVNINLVK